MKVIPPLTITDAILTSSTVSEPTAGSPSTEDIYSASNTYALGQEVISTSTHRKYESLQAGNVNHPLPVLPETTTAWWLDVGPTNKWAMFDLYRNTATEGTSPLRVVLTPGMRINCIALLGLEATSVTVQMHSAGSPQETYYSRTEDLNNREVADWYDYFFETFDTSPSMALFDLPPYTGAVLTVTITNTGGLVECGALAIGSFQYIGETQHQAESDALNFSVIERDAFGNASLTVRRSIPKSNQVVFCDKSIVNAVRDLRTALNAVPAVWSSLDDSDHEFFDALLILGIYRNFRITLADPTCSINLELEEI